MEHVDILVENVSMKFRLATEKVDSLKEYITRKLKRNLHYKEFFALKNISFQIKRGERVAILGHNGAGKSTLLKIISGVIKPSAGKVTVNGSVAPLLELGAGFDPELTGAENIFLNGAIMGKSKSFLESRYDDIVNFADLGEFIYVPVKNYSSGMRARLGFSIAVHIDADILIVDEILSVGDQQFREKSARKMLELIDSGKTVVLVSHNLNQVKQLTKKAIWLHQGEIKEIDDTETIVKNYQEFFKK